MLIRPSDTLIVRSSCDHDVKLGKLNSHANLYVSLDARKKSVYPIDEANLHMSLESNSMNWATPVR